LYRRPRREAIQRNESGGWRSAGRRGWRLVCGAAPRTCRGTWAVLDSRSWPAGCSSGLGNRSNYVCGVVDWPAFAGAVTGRGCAFACCDDVDFGLASVVGNCAVLGNVGSDERSTGSDFAAQIAATRRAQPWAAVPHDFRGSNHLHNLGTPDITNDEANVA